MIDPNTLSLLIDDIIAIRKKHESKKQSTSGVLAALGVTQKEKRTELPEYYLGYQLAAKWLDQIRVHSEKGFYPYWLFENNSPNQTATELEYVKMNYRQNTLEVFKDYIDTMGRAYHSGNYDIEYAAEDDQYIKAAITFKDYITSGLPVYESLETFVFEFLPPLKLMDAQGVVAVLPGNIEVIENDGVVIINPEKMLEPFPQFFHTTKVVGYADEYFIIEATEKSKVDFGSKQVDEGLIFWIIDDNSYYQAIQKGKKVDMLFDYVEVFKHDLGYIPVKRTGGITIQIDDMVMEQSPFLYAVDTLDEILIDSSLLRSVKANCCYPYRVMIGDPCDATMKVDGETINCIDGMFLFANGNHSVCQSCHGTGLKDRVTPTGIMLVKAKTSTTDGDGINPSDALFYASPSTETLTQLRTEIDYNFVKAYNLLHLRRDNSKIQGGAEVTATEIANENKALIAACITNSNQLFEMLSFIAKAIGEIRYGDNFKMPKIKEPVSFDFLTLEEYVDRIATVISSGQPSIITQSIIRDAAAKVFFKDVESKNIFELISRTDRLLSMTEGEINIKQSKRLIDGWEVVLHDSAMMFIEELVEENKDFFELKLVDQKTKLIEKAKAFIASITPIQQGVIQTAQSRLNSVLSPENTPPPITDDNLGKIPLALQQIALARMRALEANDKVLATQLGNKMKELVKEL